MSGRFFSQDPWSGTTTHPKTLHEYMYAAGNPIIYTDASGMDYLYTLDRYTCDDPNAVGGYVLHQDRATGLVDWWPCIVDPANVQMNPNPYRNGTEVPVAVEAPGYRHPVTNGPRPSRFGIGPSDPCVPSRPDDTAWQSRPQCWPPLPNAAEAWEQVTASFSNTPYNGPDGFAIGGSLAGGGFGGGCAPTAMINGREIVYDFFHLQRATFSYVGIGSRFATSLQAVGATGYIGILEGFSRKDNPPGIRAYGGPFLSLAGSYDVLSASPAALPEVVSAGLAAGGTFAAAYLPHMGRFDPVGIRGVYVSAGVGAQVNLPGVSAPLAAEAYLTNYELIEGSFVNYLGNRRNNEANRVAAVVRMVGDMSGTLPPDFDIYRVALDWAIRGAR
jgi:hypothetical protein